MSYRTYTDGVSGLEGVTSTFFPCRAYSSFYLLPRLSSQVYGAATMFFAASCALTGLQGFLPTIIASFGFSKHRFCPTTPLRIFTNTHCRRCGCPDLDSSSLWGCSHDSLLDNVPVGSATTSWSIPRWRRCSGGHRIRVRLLRPRVLMGMLTQGCSPHSLLIVVPSNRHVRYFATFCACAGTATNIGLILTWCTSYSILCARLALTSPLPRQSPIISARRRRRRRACRCTCLSDTAGAYWVHTCSQ